MLSLRFWDKRHGIVMGLIIVAEDESGSMTSQCHLQARSKAIIISILSSAQLDRVGVIEEVSVDHEVDPVVRAAP